MALLQQGVRTMGGPGGHRQDFSGCMATATGPVLCEHEAVGCRRAGPISAMVLGELLHSTGLREVGNK